MKTSEESAGRAHVVLWKWSEAERINGSVITRGEGSHSGGLKRGDRIFAGATKGDELYILEAMQIKRGGPDWAEGRQSIRGRSRISCVNYGLDICPVQPLENKGRGSKLTHFPQARTGEAGGESSYSL